MQTVPAHCFEMQYCSVPGFNVRFPSIPVKYHVHVSVQGECIAVGNQRDLLSLVELDVARTLPRAILPQRGQQLPGTVRAIQGFTSLTTGVRH
jgi:hypothetical protein